MARVLACMGRTVTAALVCLLAVGAAVAGGVGGTGSGGQPAAAGDAAVENGDGRTVQSENVSVTADDSGVDVSVSLDWGGVSLRTDGDGSGEGSVTHRAIDREMADAGSTGACAVGFDGEGSPLDLAFDSGNDSFGLAWAANASSGSSDGESVDADEVVEECSSSDG
jgi:hypothetical protein